MILGVVLAGGQSRRFGSDKALAEIAGRSLLTLAVDQMKGWCDHVVVAGRETAPAPCIADWPHPKMGPLAGLAAALHLARDSGYTVVLSCGVDSPNLPENLPNLLGPAPAYLADQPVIGLWPITAIAALETILTGTGRHSLYAFAEAVKARPVALAIKPVNINTADDLAQLIQK